MLNAVKTWTTDNFANILAHIDDKLLFFFCEKAAVHLVVIWYIKASLIPTFRVNRDSS